MVIDEHILLQIEDKIREACSSLLYSFHTPTMRLTLKVKIRQILNQYIAISHIDPVDRPHLALMWCMEDPSRLDIVPLAIAKKQIECSERYWVYEEI